MLRMVDFRKSSSLGIYSATKSLSSPASSSLDKAPGTLSGRSVLQAGQSAQALIASTPRVLTDDYPAAARSYTYAGALMNQDILLGAESQLINKFLVQASPAQQKSLIEASRDLSIGSQRSILEAIQSSNKSSPGEDTSSTWLYPLLLIGGAYLASELF